MGVEKKVLLTGGTGLVGSYLLKILLCNNYKVYTIVRKIGNINIRDRVFNLLKFWGGVNKKKVSKNLTIVEGDITKDWMGLNRIDRELLIDNVEQIFHCAANTNLKVPIEKIRIINVDGTKKILELAEQCKNSGQFEKVNHISTTYIIGKYNKNFFEKDLDVGQDFNSPYEQSKFEAEKYIIEEFRNKGLSIDIFRLPIIIGDSITGKIFKFNNIYQIIRLCCFEFFDTLPVLDARVNLLPIDSAAQAIYIISSNSKIFNKTYHIFPKKSISLERIIRIGSEIFNYKMPKLVSLDNYSSKKLTHIQKQLLSSVIYSINLRPKINSVATNRVLKTYDYELTPINDKILIKILKYFKTRGLNEK